MQTFEVGDTVVLHHPYTVDKEIGINTGDVGCVTSIKSNATPVEDQVVTVRFWTCLDRAYGYSAWRLKPLTS